MNNSSSFLDALPTVQSFQLEEQFLEIYLVEFLNHLDHRIKTISKKLAENFNLLGLISLQTDASELN